MSCIGALASCSSAVSLTRCDIVPCHSPLLDETTSTQNVHQALPMASMDPQRLRETIGRFRILILGRANAGKTTILQKVCNTTENPEIYDTKGDKRGNHNIRNEMVFKSNPGFGFFDSCGFEAGSEEEFEDMKNFLSERANATSLEERIHAIW
ncbi:hypothetical protein DFH29DRAFT_816619 [Suillus ampliporus]|nr:hypothetical protein DFH29DRAFT_816619 [Suillus ampliporus]